MVNLKRGFLKESTTYRAYEANRVFKCKVEDISQIIEKIKEMGTEKTCLIEIPNTVGLESTSIDNLPDNIDIRIIGAHTEEYGKSSRSINMDFSREKCTYSKSELKAILTEIEKIEKGINPNWNQLDKALYLYEYLKYNMVYRMPTDSNEDGTLIDALGDTHRTRTWDTLIGLTNKLSTCSGFSTIYQELCTRQGIEAYKIAGKYKDASQRGHAWNIVECDGKSFIVDVIWDTISYENGIDEITGFGMGNIADYHARCYQEKCASLTNLEPTVVKEAEGRVLANVAKGINGKEDVREIIKNFSKKREKDRARMRELIYGKENEEKEKNKSDFRKSLEVRDKLESDSKASNDVPNNANMQKNKVQIEDDWSR